MGVKNPDGSICYIIGIRKEIRNKILYTLMIFAIVRLGTQIALPGIDTAGVIAARENASMAGTLYSIRLYGRHSRNVAS